MQIVIICKEAWGNKEYVASLIELYKNHGAVSCIGIYFLLHPGMSHGLTFNLIPNCMRFCHGQISIETATYSLKPFISRFLCPLGELVFPPLPRSLQSRSLTLLETCKMLPVVLWATYPENQVSPDQKWVPLIDKTGSFKHGMVGKKLILLQVLTGALALQYEWS